MSQNTGLNLPDVSCDVLDFATQEDVFYDLRNVAVRTRRVFPADPFVLQLEVDESNPAQSHISVAVIGTDLAEDEIRACQQRWQNELLKYRLTYYPNLFRLVVEKKTVSG